MPDLSILDLDIRDFKEAERVHCTYVKSNFSILTDTIIIDITDTVTCPKLQIQKLCLTFHLTLI